MLNSSAARSRAARVYVRLVFAALLLAFVGVSADAAESGAIRIENFVFSPKVLTIPVGTEVIWTNKDDEPHTVVYSGEEKLFKSPPLDTDETFSFVFTKPGTYTYYCSVHPHMTATVVVE